MSRHEFIVPPAQQSFSLFPPLRGGGRFQACRSISLRVAPLGGLCSSTPDTLYAARCCSYAYPPDAGTSAQGSLCIVTELLSRGSLEDVIRRGGLRTASYGLILDLALQVGTCLFSLPAASSRAVDVFLVVRIIAWPV